MSKNIAGGCLWASVFLRPTFAHSPYRSICRSRVVAIIHCLPRFVSFRRFASHLIAAPSAGDKERRFPLVTIACKPHQRLHFSSNLPVEKGFRDSRVTQNRQANRLPILRNRGSGESVLVRHSATASLPIVMTWICDSASCNFLEYPSLRLFRKT